MAIALPGLLERGVTPQTGGAVALHAKAMINKTLTVSRPKKRMSRDRLFPYLLVAPAVILIVLLHIYPIVRGAWLSLYDYTLLYPRRPFIGLGNYREILSDPKFFSIFLNTLFFAFMANGASIVLGLGVATLLNRRSKGVGILRSITLIPWVTPPVVIAYVWVWIYSGSFSPINDLLMRFNLIKEPISFLGDTMITFLGIVLPAWSVLAVRIWTSFPFKAIMFLAALQSIPDELYESADIDGANRMQKFFYITLPSLVPVGLVLVTLSTIWNLSHFDYNYLMTRGGPFDATNVMGVYIYQTGFAVFRLGYAAAMGVIMLLFSSILAVVYMWSIRRPGADV